jgi:two-component system response regulator ChvI
MTDAQILVAEEPKRIVLVDDDDLFRESLGLNLAERGYEIIDFSDGQSALSYLERDPRPDAVLLDWRMPGLDGLGVLRGMRERAITTPVIFLTMLSDEVYEEAALRWGAVDFIDKSRRLSIILQRLRLIAGGGKAAEAETESAPATVRRGQLELRAGINRAYWKGELVDLTLTEFQIVMLLVGHVDSDVSYRQIYDVARGKGFIAGYGPEGYRANVRSFIKRIRKKFRTIDGEFAHIQNYAGFGYMWIDNPGDGEQADAWEA